MVQGKSTAAKCTGDNQTPDRVENTVFLTGTHRDNPNGIYDAMSDPVICCVPNHPALSTFLAFCPASASGIESKCRLPLVSLAFHVFFEVVSLGIGLLWENAEKLTKAAIEDPGT